MIKRLRPLGLALSSLFFLFFFALAPQAPAQSPTGTLTGTVEDPTGAVIPRAQITLTRNGRTLKATSGPEGRYIFQSLAPGAYSISAMKTGFALFTNSSVTIAAGQVKKMNLTLQIAVAQQQVQVRAETGPAISTNPANNTNALVISGKALNALSNDPTELANELQALAGPAVGPNGGQIFINGFTGGQLPPKSDILRIIVNRNPFSAQYDRPGYGRIEIITKPGTNKFQGSSFIMGNDSSFNTLDPFILPGTTIPSYYSYMINGLLSGPISKNASFFFNIEQRNTQNDNIYTTLSPVFDKATNTYSAPQSANVVGGLLNPAVHTNITPRLDLQLGQNNTLSLLYQFYRDNESGALSGSWSLPSQAYTSDLIEHKIQLDDMQIISNSLVNETRLEFVHKITTETPASTAPSFSVPSDFTDGGDASQYLSEHNNHYELQNFTTWTVGKQTVEFGTWLRDNAEALSTDAGFNGTFSFKSMSSYLDTVNGLAQGETVAQIAAACPSGQVCTPIKLTYTTGPKKFAGNIFDGALFVQDDWTVKPYLTLAGGLRFETENHIADHADWAPRIDVAYALGKHKGGGHPKTLLQAGFGFFYHRLQIGNLMSLEQYHAGPGAQIQTVITNPTCFNPTSLSDIPGGTASCGAGNTPPEVYAISPHYRSPLAEMTGVSLERQLGKVGTVTFTYLHTFGMHEMVTRDANAYEPLPGTVFYNSTTGPRPDPNLGIVEQYYAGGIYKENQLIANFNFNLSQNLSFFGFYNYSDANSDGGGGSNPSNSYDLMQDYGRASWVHPQWMLLVGQYVGPWGIIFNPFMIAQAGNPYNIVTTTDLTGDNFFNDRPAYASSSDCPSTSSSYVQTTFGCLNTEPAAGDTIIPDDLGTSPAAVALNLRLARTFGFGPVVGSAAGASRHGGHHGHFHPGGPFGGMHGGVFKGTPGGGRRYQLTFSVHALNICNDINYGMPSGSLIPTLNSSTGIYEPDSRFQQSTSLAGGIYSQGSASRRVYLHAELDF